MSVKQGSCAKRLALGCSGLFVLFVILGFLLFIAAKLNRPLEPEIASFETGDALVVNPEDRINLPGATTPAKPIRLVLDLSMAQMELKPGTNLGRVELQGDYDKANFDLITEVKERSDHIEYRVRFKNKRSFLGLFFDGSNIEARKNRITVLLAPDLLYDIDSKTRMGEYSLDFSGLALNSMKVDMSMGALKVFMEEPNQVAMESLDFDVSMGETRIYDYQNFGSKKANIQGSMGEVRVYNSGPLHQDTELFAKVTMGEFRIQVPENAKLENKTKIFMGGSSQAKETAEGGPDVDQYRLALTGGATMGELRISRGTRMMSLERRLRKLALNEGLEAMMVELRTVHANEQTKLRPSTINRLGYVMLNHRKNDAAIEIFRFNIEQHPDYANGYDSLAEAYMKSDRVDEAIENYEKAREMDPEGFTSQWRLEKLRQKKLDEPGRSSGSQETQGSNEP